MDLYPAIDLRGGRCVRLHQGDFSRETVYDADPVARALSFQAAGAPWVHVVDLDASRGLEPDTATVTAIASALSVPVQAGGGVRDASLLDAGVARVVLGSLAVAEPATAAALCSSHPGRVAIGLDHRDGELRTRGWLDASGVDVLEAAAWPEFAGAAALVVTNIARDATMAGPDLAGLARVMAVATVPVVASGGVGDLDHLRALADAGASGVIVGKALYEGAFTVEEALAACDR